MSVIGLVFHKNSHNLTLRRQTTNFKKLAKDLSTYFTKQDLQMANKHKKSCLTSLDIGEILSKTPSNAGEDMEVTAI